LHPGKTLLLGHDVQFPLTTCLRDADVIAAAAVTSATICPLSTRKFHRQEFVDAYACVVGLLTGVVRHPTAWASLRTNA
jgi:hypothetical protein